MGWPCMSAGGYFGLVIVLMILSVIASILAATGVGLVVAVPMYLGIGISQFIVSIWVFTSFIGFVTGFCVEDKYSSDDAKALLMSIAAPRTDLPHELGKIPGWSLAPGVTKTNPGTFV